MPPIVYANAIYDKISNLLQLSDVFTITSPDPLPPKS